MSSSPKEAPGKIISHVRRRPKTSVGITAGLLMAVVGGAVMTWKRKHPAITAELTHKSKQDEAKEKLISAQDSETDSV